MTANVVRLYDVIAVTQCSLFIIIIIIIIIVVVVVVVLLYA